MNVQPHVHMKDTALQLSGENLVTKRQSSILVSSMIVDDSYKKDLCRTEFDWSNVELYVSTYSVLILKVLTASFSRTWLVEWWFMGLNIQFLILKWVLMFQQAVRQTCVNIGTHSDLFGRRPPGKCSTSNFQPLTPPLLDGCNSIFREARHGKYSLANSSL